MIMLLVISVSSLSKFNCLQWENYSDNKRKLLFLIFLDPTNVRNGSIAGPISSSSNATIVNIPGPTITTTTNNIGTSGGSVVLGQIGDSILYYQNDQNQTFQL